MTKKCEVCGIDYAAKRSNQKYCPECGVDPDKARVRYAKSSNRIFATAFGDAVTERTCTHCGKVFKWASNRGQSYCSDRCKQLHLNAIMRCVICNDLIAEKKGNAYGGSKYCSDVCQREAERRRNENKEPFKYPETRTCKICGKEFNPTRDFWDTCSSACSEQYAKNLEEECTKRENAPILARCFKCGKQFKTTRKAYECYKYCSGECASAGVHHNTKPKKADKVYQVGDKTVTNPQNLCTDCKTSMRDCERFKSDYRYLPDGAKQWTFDGQSMVYECPKYK